jgi:type IV secretory pathway TraG/TraD family ATPase VirD4
MSERFLWIGRTTFRNSRRLFGIPHDDRRQHIYLIGQTGTGKSTLLHAMMRQDLVNGRGFALIDPHGDLFDAIGGRLTAEQELRVTRFDLPHPTTTFGFNPLACDDGRVRPVAAAAILDVFSKLWEDSWGPRLEHLLRYALLALVETSGAVLGDILRILRDDAFRLRVAAGVSNEQVKSFWLGEFVRMSPGRRAEAMAPIENKLGAFLAHEPLRRALSAGDSTSIRCLMDSGRILLVNLSKGRIGNDASALFGALLISTLSRLGLERADQPPHARVDFGVYADEFQSFTTLTVASMLAELRKYGVHMILAHQFLGQLDRELRDAILANAGTLVIFRTGPMDAKVLCPMLGGDIEPVDILRLPNHEAFVRPIVDGVPVQAFSAETLAL